MVGSESHKYSAAEPSEKGFALLPVAAIYAAAAVGNVNHMSHGG
jgi:hypothetical protein